MPLAAGFIIIKTKHKEHSYLMGVGEGGSSGMGLMSIPPPAFFFLGGGGGDLVATEGCLITMNIKI